MHPSQTMHSFVKIQSEIRQVHETPVVVRRLSFLLTVSEYRFHCRHWSRQTRKQIRQLCKICLIGELLDCTEETVPQIAPWKTDL